MINLKIYYIYEHIHLLTSLYKTSDWLKMYTFYVSIFLFLFVLEIKGLILNDTFFGNIKSINNTNDSKDAYTFIKNTFFCAKMEHEIDLNQYIIIFNCTMNQYQTDTPLKQIIWSIPLVWLFFIPILLTFFSYITRCIFKFHSENKQRSDMLYHNGNLA